MSFTPKQYYQRHLNAGDIEYDQQQWDVLERMEKVYHDLVQRDRALRTPVKRFFVSKKPVEGIYLWGSVGIGKTFIMDCFFNSLPFKRKLRMHFFAFMQHIHHDMQRLQGVKNPLKIIAKKLAKQTRVLCFDEFFVSDITDAMILSGLIKALFDEGLCLVATSNIDPDQLYKNGLQRQNFIPAIRLIKEHTSIIYLDSFKDYRAQHLKAAGVYYTPLDKAAEKNMEKAFALYRKTDVSDSPIELFGRKIQVIKRSDKVIWFDFKKICGVPRSSKDYLALSKQYDVVLISNIPIISERQHDLITSFINLVDIFYDAGVKLIISAEQPPNALYQKGRLSFEFARTHSRLLEMQSMTYFSPEDA
ncbi:MAG: cell division protein ZapE [Gammaproteobacteria bacterium]